MPTNNDAVTRNGNRPTPLDRAAQAFTEICARTDTPTVNGRAIGHGLPPRAMSARELAEVLPLFEAEARDAVWRELVRLAREVGEPWPTIATGIALPGLRTAAGRLVRDYDGDPEDLDAELIAAFYEAITHATVDGPMICAKLRAAAYNQVRRMRYGATSYATRTRGLDALSRACATPPPSGHPDVVLAASVRAGVITRQEAALIGDSRLEKTSLSSVARRLGVPVTTAWCRRKAAETRLVAWINDDQTQA
jgi:hypothetical protein